MFSALSKLPMILLLSLVFAGALLDRADVRAQDGLPGACDRRCRMRTDHMFCDSGTCFRASRSTCNWCGTSLNARCTVQMGDSTLLFPTCAPDSLVPFINVQYYGQCSPACACSDDGGTIDNPPPPPALVEASGLANGGDWSPIAFDRYTCQ